MTNNIQFRQSCNDFPLTVGLGRKVPEWSLSRWKENKGLRFVPFYDEGFTLRGEKRQLLYKGNRRSHRFTILNDGAFEYDCILLKEPESNVISLRMEGAENFDFFRQPGFVRDPFLKGSYAVYLKDTFIGQGTGKLCHIHRPLIIDALGRECWGVLFVVGDEMRITIPEEWLSNAKYPVVVDPFVGTTTVGSQNIVYGFEPGDEDEWFYHTLYDEVGVNRFVLPEKLSGLVTAYCYLKRTPTYFNPSVTNNINNHILPVLYSEVDNYPYARLSSNEMLFDSEVNTSDKPEGWRTAQFNITNTIEAGSNIWFGVSAKRFMTTFDFGTRFVWAYAEGGLPPNIFHEYEYYEYREADQWNLIVSWYFDYSADYVRKLTQGVTLNDTKEVKTGFFRKIENTLNVVSIRDYILRRFLIAKEVINLKSCITKELTLESKLN